MTPILR